MPGGGRGSWTPSLLGENDHPVLAHHHSGSNSAAGLATPVKTVSLNVCLLSLNFINSKALCKLDVFSD